MEDNFTENLREAIKNSAAIAKKYKLGYIGTEHILCGLLSRTQSYTARMLSDYGVTYAALFNEIKKNLESSNFASKPVFTPNTKGVLSEAVNVALDSGVEYVGTEHVLYSLLCNDACRACLYLRRLGAPTERIRAELYSRFAESARKNSAKYTSGYSNGNQNGQYAVNGEPTNEYNGENNANERLVGDKNEKTKDNSPIADFGIDLTECAKKGKLDPVIGRSEEIERVIRTLSRRTKNSPVLVGEAGVGKSAVVEGLAQAMVKSQVPETLAGKRLFSLDMSGLLAGAKFRGEFEQRFKNAVDYLKNDKNTILFIDEIHNIVGAGGNADGSMDAAEILKPSLARGEIQIIGATTFDEYRKYIEKDPALERRFQPITIDPPDSESAKAILRGLRDKYEAHHKVIITDQAIDASVELSERYITDRFLPDKAIDLMDEAAARAKLKALERGKDLSDAHNKLQRLYLDRDYYRDQGDTVSLNSIENKILRAKAELGRLQSGSLDRRAETRPSIGAEDIAEIISEWTDIPLTKIGNEESARLLHLEDELHKRVIGQENAVSAVARALKRARADLKDPKRPNGSFIFVGPTGVGKTELAKALAECVFGDENAIIRIDMSEYPEKHDVSKLIGAPPGYVGYDEEGQLTERVRRKPYSVVLFDEIEKAHPDIFNLFLQILDDGRLTDSKGRLVDFKNTIIIMTSNVGASECERACFAAGFGDVQGHRQDANEIITEALRKKFKPEFLNRVDDIITFRKLTQEECGKIVNLLLADLKKRLKAKRITMIVDETAEKVILSRGYDPEYGARPLKRVIQRLIEDMLSEEIISGAIVEGDVIKIYGENNSIGYVIV